ncbi:hypothetical protein [Deinococcus depolymerans]|uniref:Uncharacterized protein n=1 Tax=Deinococcus depolymerans TaxID=392408 RepID=A0ABP3MJP5_9DEIO
MRTPLKTRLPLIALATLPLTVGLVFAQQGGAGTSASNTTAAPQRVKPAQPGQTQNGPAQNSQTQGQQDRAARSGTNYADTFIKNLAAQLNTTPEKLRAAAVKAGTTTIDAAVKAGDIPADRAADMKARLAENPFGFGGGRGHGMRGDHGPRDGQRGPRGQQPGAPAGSADQGGTYQGGTDQGGAAASDTTSGT